MTRMMPGTDPRFRTYDAWQRLLCAVLNLDVHYDTAHAPIDRVTWVVDRELAADGIRQQMTRLARTGLDDVPLSE